MKKVHKQVKIKRYESKVKDPKRNETSLRVLLENIGISYPMHTTEIPILTSCIC